MTDGDEMSGPTSDERVEAGIDRAAALAAPPNRVPRKAIYWGLAVLVVLGGGGVLLENVFTGAGLNAYSVTAASPSSTTKTTKKAPASAVTSMRDLMGITRLSGSVAPSLSLTDQAGARVTLSSLKGRPVVLTFFDAACDDICPVLGAEVLAAEKALGADAKRVDFVAVDTDPRALSTAATQSTSVKLGLAAYSNWHFLSGSIGALDVAWTRYGITVEVADTTHRVSHTDLLYFIDPEGRLRFTATPFANESRSGTFSLERATIDRFGLGIADYARQLLP